MTKYLFLYRTESSNQTRNPSPDEMQAMMAQWAEWKTKFKDSIVDVGDGLKPGGRVYTAGEVTDGAFAEAKEVLGGYSMVQAVSYDAAVEVARTCPVTQMPGYSIEIRELAGY